MHTGEPQRYQFNIITIVDNNGNININDNNANTKYNMNNNNNSNNTNNNNNNDKTITLIIILLLLLLSLLLLLLLLLLSLLLLLLLLLPLSLLIIVVINATGLWPLASTPCGGEVRRGVTSGVSRETSLKHAFARSNRQHTSTEQVIPEPLMYLVVPSLLRLCLWSPGRWTPRLAVVCQRHDVL